jgi:hypothetical protein
MKDIGSRQLRKRAAVRVAFAVALAALLNQQDDCYLPIRHERKAFTEIILGDFLIVLGTASADSNSDPESVGYLNLIDALTPTLVGFDFFHLEGLPVLF